MDESQLISQARRIIEVANSQSEGGAHGGLAEAREFLRIYAGDKSSFLKSLHEVGSHWSSAAISRHVVIVMDSYIRFVESGLAGGVSIQRQAQLDAVSDFLQQAQQLLETKGVHPAAPAMLIGAALEEFLRSWIEDVQLSIGTRRAGIEAYSQALREADLIRKQDAKDIVSWAGLRNHAAHGEWDLVGEPTRVRLALEGVNLFMRKYSA